MNTATITGSITEPELRFTPGGKAVCNFAVAVKGRKDPKTDERPTFFVNCSVWEDMGENFAELPKGTRVTVTGRLDPREWEDKDGNTRRVLELTVDDGGPDLRFDRATVAERDSNGSEPRSGWSGSASDEDVPF